jgi:hypothetical protein
MGLDFALDELYATGWSNLDTAGCSYHRDGRAFPSVARVKGEFAAAGFDLAIQHAANYNCYRASWAPAGGADGATAGAVVGHSESEAAVFALAHLRRHLVAAAD